MRKKKQIFGQLTLPTGFKTWIEQHFLMIGGNLKDTKLEKILKTCG
ncbi:TPA: hypothetical protein ACF8NL_001297 [Streptococcus agalactiae]